ncbi:MAG: TonB-dependent receptor, partial [Bacteroidota bacterium]|nr:TonB-dependent receptor [Bacteroidota bacterium]
DGSFIITNVNEGNYTLSVTASNFASVQKEIVVKDENAPITIQLQSIIQQLNAVTVTAEKREENAELLPLSVSVLSSQKVADYQLWNSNELTAIVPSLFSDNSGDARNVTSIRGIVTTSYDPAVATYIDGVNQFSLDTYISTLTDVERIEILRGPQGTLYGRNAMGGVINIITKQPTNHTDAFAEINIGNHGLQRYNAGFRTPLIKDKLFLGLSLLFDGRNGFYHNDYNNTSFDKQHLFYGNYYLKFLPGKKWAITANVKHQANRNNGAFPLVNGVEEALANPFHLDQNATATMFDNTFNSSLVINHAGNEVSFNSISSYQNNYRYYNAPLDGDFSPADIVSIVNNYGKKYNNVKVFTQEFRISSNNQKRKLQYTAGAYFFYQNNPAKQGTYYGKDANAAYGIGDSMFTTIATSKGVGYGTAVYGQLQYAITPKLKVVGGIRYDYEHRKLSVESEYQKGTFNLNTLPDTSATARFHALSPKASLQYLVSNNNNVYFTYSRGYRVGGLSPLSPDPSQPPLYAYLPENSNNYEAGSKNVFWDDKLQLNVAAYTTFINNAQVPTLVLPQAVTIIKNTGRLQTNGIEAEVAATPLKGLQIDYNAGIVHTKYTSLKIAQNGTEVNLDGKKQIYTPAATSMLAAQYNFVLSKEAKLMVRGEWQYRGKMYFDFANTIAQDGYNLFGARVGVETKEVGVYVWGRNLSNTKYIAYAYDFGAVHLGDPRTYGITISAKL